MALLDPLFDYDDSNHFSIIALPSCHKHLYNDVTYLSTMLSLTPPTMTSLNLSPMTSLTFLLWRHLPLYYAVTHPSDYDYDVTTTSLTSLLWRHLPFSYDVTYSSELYLHNYVTYLSPRTSQRRHLLLYYDVTYSSTMTLLIPLLWRH